MVRETPSEEVTFTLSAYWQEGTRMGTEGESSADIMNSNCSVKRGGPSLSVGNTDRRAVRGLRRLGE